MPRDCTAHPLVFTECTVPSSLVVSHTMTKNKKQQQKKTVKTAKSNNTKKNTPFRDIGGVIGTVAGSFFENPIAGANIGKWLGSGIGSIFGSGDYTTVGPRPSYNVLSGSAQIPKFSATHSTNIVCHREYLGDIAGTATFNNKSYPLNPGMEQTFPWLSTIAGNYQEYRFHGLIFEFRPLITDFVTSGQPGVIIMSTNYNSEASAYTSRQQMENAEFAVSVKPTTAMIHAIECKMSETPLKELYVRSTPPINGDDLRMSDLGKFQFATQANPVIDLGELWVSYCVEFFKPIIPVVNALNLYAHHRRANGSPGLYALGGQAGTIPCDEIGLIIDGTTLTFPVGFNGTIQLLLAHSGDSTVCASMTVAAVTANVQTITNTFNIGTANSATAPTAATVTNSMFTAYFRITADTNAAKIIFAAALVPGNSNVDVYVHRVSDTIL